ncbi:hypothetical protein J6590_060129, partial [Homalodisca vitripennis]
TQGTSNSKYLFGTLRIDETAGVSVRSCFTQTTEKVSGVKGFAGDLDDASLTAVWVEGEGDVT